MKLETAVLVTKGACLVIIPTFTVINEGLKKVSSPTVLGIDKELAELFCSAIVAGAGGLLAFLSTSFGTYMTKRNGVAVTPQAP